MDNEADYDVVVIGLGPVGLMSAALFGIAGLRVLGIERTDGSHVRPRATALDDENVRTLLKLGIAEEFMSKSLPAAPMQIVTEYTHKDSGDPVLLFGAQHPTKGVGKPGNFPEVIFPGGHKSHEECHNGVRPGSYLFYQPELERLLREYLLKLPNVETRYSTECTAIDQNNHELAAVHLGPSDGKWQKQSGGEWIFVLAENKIKTSEVLNTKFIVGCDGARSFVRTYINPVRDYISLDYDKEWIAIDIMLNNEDEIMGKKLSSWSQTLCNDDTQCIVIPCSYCYDMPAKGRHIRFDFEVPTSYKGSTEKLQSVEAIHELLSTWLEPGDYKLIRATVYRFHCLVSPKWRDRRVFIAGDACHTMPPFLGQGLNQGVKDIANLWWKIVASVNGKAHDSLLDSYQQERYARAMKVVASSMAVGKVMESLKECHKLGGNERCIQYAVDQRKNGFRIEKLFSLARSQIDILKPIYGGHSQYDGQTFPQLMLRKSCSDDRIRFDDIFNKSKDFYPIVVVLSGILNNLKTCMTSNRAAYIESLGIPIVKIAKYSETKPFTNLTSPGASENGDYYIIDQNAKILETQDVIIVRRDGIIYGAAKNVQNVDNLVDELKYSGYYKANSVL